MSYVSLFKRFWDQDLEFFEWKSAVRFPIGLQIWHQPLWKSVNRYARIQTGDTTILVKTSILCYVIMVKTKSYYLTHGCIYISLYSYGVLVSRGLMSFQEMGRFSYIAHSNEECCVPMTVILGAVGRLV